jgi:hypothetical protein
MLSWRWPINKVETFCSIEHFLTQLCRLLLRNYILKYFEVVPEKLCNINTNISSQTSDLMFPWLTLRIRPYSGVWRLAGRQTGISQITKRDILSSGMSLSPHKVNGYTLLDEVLVFFLLGHSDPWRTEYYVDWTLREVPSDTASYPRKTDTSATQLRKSKNY